MNSQQNPGGDVSPLFDDCLAQLVGAIPLLPDKPEETAETTLRALWWAAAELPRSAEWASADALPVLTPDQMATLHTLVRRRLEGEPLSYVTGRQRFMDLEMRAAPGALIPRKETELIGRAALALVRAVADRQGTVTVVDVCTGCGNLAIAYAVHEPRARVLAADLSEDAVAIAVENARLLNVAASVDFRTGDLLAPFGPDLNGQVDVLSCNPPYISTAKVAVMPDEISRYEPVLAFDGGAFGVKILTRLTQDALRLLKPGGWLAFEVGLGQGPAMRKRLETAGAYTEVREIRDSGGQVRALVAQTGTV